MLLVSYDISDDNLRTHFAIFLSHLPPFEMGVGDLVSTIVDST